MNILKENKTNWKYISIVLLFAVIISAGILDWIKKEEIPPSELPETEEPEKQLETEKEQSPEELLHEAIVKSFCDGCGGCCDGDRGDWGKFVTVDYDTKSIDLNDDGNNEIIARGIRFVFEFFSYHMGGVTGNQNFHILRQQNSKWIEIGSINCESYSIGGTKTKGFYDIITDSDVGGAGCLRVIAYYEWDGFYYNKVSSEEKNRCVLE